MGGRFLRLGELWIKVRLWVGSDIGTVTNREKMIPPKGVGVAAFLTWSQSP